MGSGDDPSRPEIRRRDITGMRPIDFLVRPKKCAPESRRKTLTSSRPCHNMAKVLIVTSFDF